MPVTRTYSRSQALELLDRDIQHLELALTCVRAIRAAVDASEADLVVEDGQTKLEVREEALARVR